MGWALISRRVPSGSLVVNLRIAIPGYPSGMLHGFMRRCHRSRISRLSDRLGAGARMVNQRTTGNCTLTSGVASGLIHDELHAGSRLGLELGEGLELAITRGNLRSTMWVGRHLLISSWGRLCWSGRYHLAAGMPTCRRTKRRPVPRPSWLHRRYQRFSTEERHGKCAENRIQSGWGWLSWLIAREYRRWPASRIPG